MILFLSQALFTAPPDQARHFAFIESKIRPVLVSKCYLLPASSAQKRMNSRRLGIEAYRDTLLRLSGIADGARRIGA